MSRSLPHQTLTTSTSSLSPISSTSPIFPTVSPTHTRSMVLDPYLPCDVPRKSGGSTQIPSLTLCCCSGVFKVLSGHGGAFAIITCWRSNQRLLLATKWSFFSLVLKSWTNCCLLSSSTSWCTWTNPFVFRQALHGLNVHFSIGASFQVICHCPLPPPFFPTNSTQPAALPSPLVPVFDSMKKTSFAAIQCLSHRVLLATKNSLRPSERRSQISRNRFRPLLLPRFVWNPHPNHPDPAKTPALQLPLSCYNFLPGAVSFLQRSFCHAHSKSAAPPRNAPAPLQTKNTKFAVAWAASFFVSLRTSSLLA